MGTVIIYRFTNVNDTISTAEKITLDDSTDVNDTKAIVNKDAGSLKIIPTTAIGDNQGAEVELGDKQSLSTFEKIYRIAMVIYQMKPASGTNAIVDTITKWESEAKATLGKFPQGRFGVAVSDVPKFDLIPIPTTGTNPQGLMWLDIEYDFDFENNQLKVVLRLTASKGNGT